jgi:AraC-like DNA-binding protein
MRQRNIVTKSASLQIMKKASTIPVHSLDSEARQGILVTKFSGQNTIHARVQAAHRDDHYIFILQEKGDNRMMLDFKEVKIKGSVLFCVLPGQVHHGIVSTSTHGWFLAMDASLVSDSYRSVFEQQLAQLPPVRLKQDDVERIGHCMQLLDNENRRTDDGPHQQQVIRSLADVVVGMFALAYAPAVAEKQPAGRRSTQITRQFKGLLQISYKIMKSPSAYAAALNISPAYLNEAVRETTGMPVSYWIQQEIIMEAKRMLYYTDVTVKEIAYALGYDDHTYFSRLFQKTTGMSALAFRKKHRE